MTSHLKQVDEWGNPENKYLFLSINNFAKYLGIPQKAIMSLVNSKLLDSLVVEGRTFIPIKTRWLLIWSRQSMADCEPEPNSNWGLTKEEGQL